MGTKETKSTKTPEAYIVVARGYIKSGEPDPILRGEYIQRARGDRSIRDFAEELGIPSSRLYRMETGKVTSIADGFLKRIVELAAPGSDITIDEILRSNGRKKDAKIATRDAIQKFNQIGSDIIRSELFRGNHSCSNAGDVTVPVFSDGSRFGMAVRTDVLNDKVWLFDFRGYDERDPHTGFDEFIVFHRIVSYMAIFYCGSEDIVKCSFVVNSLEVFEHHKKVLMERMGEQKIKDLISLILVDVKQKYVIEEWHIPTEAEVPEIFSGEVPDSTDNTGLYNEGAAAFDEYYNQ